MAASQWRKLLEKEERKKRVKRVGFMSIPHDSCGTRHSLTYIRTCSRENEREIHLQTLYTLRFRTAEFVGYIGKWSISGQFCPYCSIWGSNFCWLYREMYYTGIGYKLVFIGTEANTLVKRASFLSRVLRKKILHESVREGSHLINEARFVQVRNPDSHPYFSSERYRSS